MAINFVAPLMKLSAACEGTSTVEISRNSLLLTSNDDSLCRFLVVHLRLVLLGMSYGSRGRLPSYSGTCSVISDIVVQVIGVGEGGLGGVETEGVARSNTFTLGKRLIQPLTRNTCTNSLVHTFLSTESDFSVRHNLVSPVRMPVLHRTLRDESRE